MNKYRVVFVILGMLCGPAYSRDPQSQGEMNHVAAVSYGKTDDRLNRVYKKILGTFDGSKKMKLIASERAWVTYRDVEADFEADVVARGGTMASSIYNGAREEMTDTRIKQLRNITGPDFTLSKGTRGKNDTDFVAAFHAAEERLNATYQGLLPTFDAQGKEKLAASESAWLAYRDAQAAFEVDMLARKGGATAIYNHACAGMTEARIKQLQDSTEVR